MSGVIERTAVDGPGARASRGSSGVGTAVRTATSELWFHPWSALAANVLVFGPALALAVLATVWPFAALVLAPLLALPVAGLYRTAARIIRGEAVSTREACSAWRGHGRRALTLGLGVLVMVAVLATDLVVGLVAIGGPVGWVLATAAGWALAAGWVTVLHVWPLLMDPAHDRTVREAARTGLRVAMVVPGRAVRLTLVSSLVLAVATVLFASLATFALAWVALLGCVVVLPIADRIEGKGR